jgi:hypothetical protein
MAGKRREDVHEEEVQGLVKKGSELFSLDNRGNRLLDLTDASGTYTDVASLTSVDVNPFISGLTGFSLGNIANNIIHIANFGPIINNACLEFASTIPEDVSTDGVLSNYVDSDGTGVINWEQDFPIMPADFTLEVTAYYGDQTWTKSFSVHFSSTEMPPAPSNTDVVRPLMDISADDIPEIWGYLVMGAGQSKSVTLTLNNPYYGSDPVAGIWSLNYDPSKISVDGAMENENHFVTGLSSSQTITLNLTGVCAGGTVLTATWKVFTGYDYNNNPAFCLRTDQTLNFAVASADIDIDADVMAVQENGPSDLVPAHLSLNGIGPSAPGQMQGKLQASDNVQIWADPNMTNLLVPYGSTATFDLYYVQEWPMTVYVEGVAPGDAQLDFTVQVNGTPLKPATSKLGVINLGSLTVSLSDDPNKKEKVSDSTPKDLYVNVDYRGFINLDIKSDFAPADKSEYVHWKILQNGKIIENGTGSFDKSNTISNFKLKCGYDAYPHFNIIVWLEDKYHNQIGGVKNTREIDIHVGWKGGIVRIYYDSSKAPDNFVGMSVEDEMNKYLRNHKVGIMVQLIDIKNTSVPPLGEQNPGCAQITYNSFIDFQTGGATQGNRPMGAYFYNLASHPNRYTGTINTAEANYEFGLPRSENGLFGLAAAPIYSNVFLHEAFFHGLLRGSDPDPITGIGRISGSTMQNYSNAATRPLPISPTEIQNLKNLFPDNNWFPPPPPGI